ncbi:MAG: TolC family outer membrane protein [Magnetococcales bacterium]|nr:TolC family outer membrane protein [Magnetococcales bacterium]
MRNGLLLLLLLGQTVAAQAAGSFVEPVEAAMHGNPRTQAAEARLRAAKEKHNQSRALLRPSIDASLSRTHTDLTWPEHHTSTDPLMLGVTLKQSLYSQKAWIALRQSRPYIAAGEAELRAAMQGVFLDTVVAITELLQAREVAQLAGNNRELIARHLEETRARFKVGQLTITDVSRAEARLSAAEANLVRSGSALAVARARFQEMTGLEEPENLALPEVRSGLLELPLERMLERGSARPDLEAARLRLRVAEEEVAMKRAGHLPTVALTLKAARGWGEEIAGTTDPVGHYEVGVGVSVPVYAGGMTVAETDEALALRDAQQAEVELLRRRMTREVESAVRDLQGLEAADRSLRGSLSAAELAMRGVEEEFRVGTRTALELLDARNEEFTARTELTRNRFALSLARFRLLAAMGELTLEALHDL